MTLAYADAAQITAALSPAEAVETLRRTLREGYDPAADTPRSSLDLPNGQMLIMPSSTGSAAGIKVLTVAPDDPQRTLPRIQGQYLLFNGETLSPRMVLDGEALTDLRTPAVSLAGVRHLIDSSPEARAGQPLDVAIFGTGPQAVAHDRTVRDVMRGIRPVTTTFISRTRPESEGPWEASCWASAGSPEAERATSKAGLILCCTTAATPILDLPQVRADAVIVAVGSHSPDARELTSELMGAARVIVENPETALAEAGDLVLAITDGALDPADLVTLRDVVREEATGDDAGGRPARPTVFKTTGMSWQDLVLAQAVADRTEER